MRVSSTQIAFVVNAEKSGYCSKTAKALTTEKIMIIGSLVMFLMRKTAVTGGLSVPAYCALFGGEQILIDKQLTSKE